MISSHARKYAGSLYHNFGTADANALLPNVLSFVLGIIRKLPPLDRRNVDGMHEIMSHDKHNGARLHGIFIRSCNIAGNDGGH